jgi:hypothetical protein
MYVFTSAVFFLVFFSLVNFSEENISQGSENAKLKEGLNTAKVEALKKAKTKEDSVAIIKSLELLGYKDSGKTSQPDTAFIKNMGGIKFNMGSTVTSYKTVREYDSAQKSLPEGKKDGRLTKVFTRKTVELNEKYKNDQQKIAIVVINKFLHSFPYLLFVSLPLYALFLKLLYIRHRKQYYFADHAVFLVHLYIFTFLFLLFYFGLDKLEKQTHWSGIGWIQGIFIATGLFYTIKAMKYFYRQGWGKTIFKFIVFNILCMISLGLLFAIFFIYSFYQV